MSCFTDGSYRTQHFNIWSLNRKIIVADKSSNRLTTDNSKTIIKDPTIKSASRDVDPSVKIPFEFGFCTIENKNTHIGQVAGFAHQIE